MEKRKWVGDRTEPSRRALLINLKNERWHSTIKYLCQLISKAFEVSSATWKVSEEQKTKSQRKRSTVEPSLPKSYRQWEKRIVLYNVSLKNFGNYGSFSNGSTRLKASEELLFFEIVFKYRRNNLPREDVSLNTCFEDHKRITSESQDFFVLSLERAEMLS